MGHIHMAHDVWHMAHDMWHMTGGGRWTFSQNFSSLAFMVWEWSFDEDIFPNDDWPSLSVTKVFVEQVIYTGTGNTLWLVFTWMLSFKVLPL